MFVLCGFRTFTSARNYHKQLNFLSWDWSSSMREEISFSPFTRISACITSAALRLFSLGTSGLSSFNLGKLLSRESTTISSNSFILSSLYELGIMLFTHLYFIWTNYTILFLFLQYPPSC